MGRSPGFKGRADSGGRWGMEWSSLAPPAQGWRNPKIFSPEGALYVYVFPQEEVGQDILPPIPTGAIGS